MIRQNMFKLNRKVALVIGSLALTPLGWSAETVDGWDLRYAGSAIAGVSVQYDGTTISCGAGLLKFDPQADTFSALGQSFPVMGTAFWTFCTDVGVWLYTSGTGDEANGWDYIPQAFSGQDGVNPRWKVGGVYEAAYMYNKLIEGYASVVAGPAQSKTWGDLAFDPLVNNNGYAAAQIAIWEALYDDTYSLTGGRFRLNTTGDIATKAAAILAQLQADKDANGGVLPIIYETTWLQPIYDNGTEGGSQGLLYPPIVLQIEDTEPLPVPDGGITLVLFGLAILGLRAVRSRTARA
jgi:hypothetical protein